MTVEEGHPLKQGLKLQSFYNSITNFIVEEGHPLKQGLKLYIKIRLFFHGLSLKRDIH